VGSSPGTSEAAPPPEGRPRRADAERSIARILAAARRVLSQNPGASIDEIARAAGVGRMTLYGHFRSRPELVEAALVQALASGEEVLSRIDLSGDPGAAMRRLLTASWSLVAESGGLLAAADGIVAAERLRQLHDRPAERVTALIQRGQAEGAFRSDLPLTWLTAAVHLLIKGGAGEIHAGRLDPDRAPDIVGTSVLALLAPPHGGPA
jgi:AcrR family transcriptional regulator